MRRRLYILAILVFITSFNVIACSCGYLGGFVYSNQVSDIVVYGRVIEYDSVGTFNAPENPYSMKFQIIEKLRGIESKDTIIILGDDGADCRPYIGHFKPNTEWILALDKLDHKGNSNYEISICGEFYVPVKAGMVKGKLFGWGYEEKENTFDYNFIKNLVQKPSEYSLQRPQKRLRKTVHGLEYMSYCDFLPQNSLDLSIINEIVREKLLVSNEFMSIGDSYLINARIIIDNNGDFYFNGTYNNHLNPTIELTMIENQLANILRNVGHWQSGLEAGNPVTAEVIIPLLLKK